MKKLALMACALLVVAGVASAAGTAAPSTKAASTKAPAMKTHVIEAEVVSADNAARTLTVKTDKGDSTVKVEGAAATHLKTLKAGEKVKLTCRDNAMGEHEAITHITVEKGMATAGAPRK
jgi:hypothetical protein